MIHGAFVHDEEEYQVVQMSKNTADIEKVFHSYLTSKPTLFEGIYATVHVVVNAHFEQRSVRNEDIQTSSFSAYALTTIHRHYFESHGYPDLYPSLIRPCCDDLNVVPTVNLNYYVLNSNFQVDCQCHVEMKKYKRDLDMNQMDFAEKVEKHLLLKKHSP